MGILKGTLCYLGGNLEYTADAEGWRDSLTKKLNNLGIKCLDPTKQTLINQAAETEEDRKQLKEWRAAGEFEKIHDFMISVIRRDLRLIDYSSFVIFQLEPDKPTFGTVHELSISSVQRKPILIIIRDRKTMPLWLMGLINMDFVFESQDELIDYLIKIDNGEVELDSKYWKLLTEELR